MFAEAAQAPAAVRAQLQANRAAVESLVERLRSAPPRAVVTLGRGSSDHASTYARYLIETRLGIMTSSAAPSVSSVYDAAPDMDHVLCLAISQSGKSPDLLAAAQGAHAAGALVVALVNDEHSPLASMAQLVLPLKAGPELSVAATKSYIGALAAAAQLVACWSGDVALQVALEGLPDLLSQAWELDWAPALPALESARSLYVLGRGIGYGAAQEAALKFKETCGLHAEAFSTAEVRHGPIALVGPDLPVLAFVQDDETRPGAEQVAEACAAQGAAVMQAGGQARTGVTPLPTLASHPVLEPIAQIQSLYRMANALALARGFDPDRPPHLRKITETM
jgi:glucosamine--fructose-6-phosphate aminotransferase (isomerizing)